MEWIKPAAHLGNSLYVTTLTVIIVVIVATPAAYGFARYNFRGQGRLFYAFIAAMPIPGQAILIPMFQILKSLRLLNILTGLALPTSAAPSPRGLPHAGLLREPAPRARGRRQEDGSNEWRVFWHVYLPLAKPGIATVVIIQSLRIWNEFMFSNTFISSPDIKTIQSAVFQSVGRYSTNYTALSSGLILALIPIFTIFLILQKQFIEGLTAGAVKG